MQKLVLPGRHRKWAGWLIPLTAALGIPATPARAMQSTDESEPAEATVDRDLRAQEDPTIIMSRVWIENEWNNNQNDRTSNETTLGLRLGWRITENHEWGVQAELPYVRNTIDAPMGDLVNQGIGDLRVTIGTAFRLGPTVRIGGGLELRMPTGDGDVSANIWRLQEFVAVAWDATPWLTFAPKLRYYHTIGRQDFASPQNYWELYVPATFILPNQWSLTTRYEVRLDHVSDHTTHSANFSVGKQVSPSRIVLSAALKVPFNSLTNDYQIVFNATMHF